MELTSNRELQISPMKLLSLAIRTASLTEMVVLPLLRIVWLCFSLESEASAPSSLQSKTGSSRVSYTQATE